MKWTKDMEERLAELCYKDVPNKKIAKDLGCDVKDVHVKRSQLGITIAKCKKAKQDEASAPEAVAENPSLMCPMRSTIGTSNVCARCARGACAWWVEYQDPADSCCALVGIFDSIARG